MSGLAKHIPGTKAHDMKKAEEQAYNSNSSTGGLHDYPTTSGTSAYDHTSSGIEESVNPSSGAGTAGNNGAWHAPEASVTSPTGYNYSYPTQTHPSQYSSGATRNTTTSRYADGTQNVNPRTSPTHSNGSNNPKPSPPVGNVAYNDARRPGHENYDSRSSSGLKDSSRTAYPDTGATQQQYTSTTGAGYNSNFRPAAGVPEGMQGPSREAHPDYGYYSSTAVHPPPRDEDRQMGGHTMAQNMTQSTTTTTPSGYTTTTTITPHTTRPQPEERVAMAGAIQGESTTAHAVGFAKGIQAKAERFRDAANRAADEADDRLARSRYGPSGQTQRTNGYS